MLAVYTVDSLQDNTTAGDGLTTLREAIAQAATVAGPDTIEFDPSLAHKTIELSLGQITVDSDVSIVGLGAGLLTVNANGSSTEPSRIFTINAGRTVSISGLTLTGGHVTGTSDGGGIHNSGTLTLDEVVLAGNYANDQGGAIYNNSGNLTIIDSTIERNQAGRGAGIYYFRSVAGAGNLDIIGSAILDNQTFWNGQSGSDYGGGLLVYSFASPHATASIVNTTFSGNTAKYGAGVVTSGYPTLEFVNSTIANNSASQQGGGIFNTNNNAIITLHNTILAGNAAGISNTRNIAGTLHASSSHNLLGPGNTGGLTNGSNGNIVLGPSENPGLAVLGDYGGPTKTHALLPGSRAIDKGSDAQSKDASNNPLIKDQRGLSRLVDIDPIGPTGGVVDIGAVEWHRPVAIGDFDGDGRDDEAFLGYGTSLYVASMPGGQLRISKWGDIATTAVGGWQVGDFNGDGRDDLAYRTNFFNAWSVAFSESNRFVVTSTGISGHAWPVVLVGDFDGDGSDELVGRYDTGGPSGTGIWEMIDYNEPTGFTRYDFGTALVAESKNGSKVHVGDIVGNGLDDLVAYSGSNWWVAIASIDTEGRAHLPATATNVGNWFRAPWVTDLGLSTESVDVEGPYRKLLEIFSEVYNTVELEIYSGLMKGIQATADTKAGNDWDQAALLVSRLEAAGFEADIASGLVDVSPTEAMKWIGTTTPEAASSVIKGALDGKATASGGNIRFQHAWVRAKVPTATDLEWVDLDPSWKFKDRQPGILTTPTTFDEFAYLSQTGNQLPVEFFEDQVMQYLANLNASLAEVAYDGPILQKQFSTIPVGLGFGVATTGTVETFANLTAILADPDPTKRNRLVHQATISLSREVVTDSRALGIVVPGSHGTTFPSADFDAPSARQISVTATPSTYTVGDAGPSDNGSTSVPQSGVRRLTGTKHVAISIPGGYTVTANTRMLITYNSNAVGHGLVFGWDQNLSYNGGSSEQVTLYTIGSGQQSLVLPSSSSGYTSNYIVLGLRHSNHNSNSLLSTASWLDVTEVKLYEQNTGTATVLDVAGGKAIRQLGDHYLSLGAAALNYQVTTNSVLDVEFKSSSAGTMHAIGWDIDDSSFNDAGQVSRRFKLAGSATTYPLVNPVETLPDGYKRYRVPIGTGIGANQSALLNRLIFFTDGSSSTESLFRNLKLTTDIDVGGTHWQTPALAIPQYSLSSIYVDYVKSNGASTTTDDDTYRSQLWVGGELFAQGDSNEIFQVGDNVKLQIAHQRPTDFVDTASTVVDPTNVYARKPGQILAVGFDANQYSRQHIIGLQAGLNTLMLDGDQVFDIDELLNYTAAKYWYDFNRSNEYIDALMHTVGGQQWVGSGIVTADPFLLQIPPEAIAHLQFPIVPRDMGVDLPNVTHVSYDIGSTTGGINTEAFQLMGYNSSALENAILEEVINSESVSTIRGLQRAYDDIRGLRFDDSTIGREAIQVFESVDNGGTRTVYFRGEIGDNVVTSYDANRTEMERNQSQLLSLEDGGLKNHVKEAQNIVNLLFQQNGQIGAQGTIRVLVPRSRSELGDWSGTVYVAEYQTSSGRRGSYIISPDDGTATSGGYSGNVVTPKNLLLSKSTFDFNPYAGDPVNVANGNMFRDETDIVYANVGVSLNFARHYDSQSVFDIGLGVGWVHSFSDRLLQKPGDANTLEWLTSSGALLKFTKTAGLWKAPDSRFGEFTETTTTYEWRGADGMEYHFKKVNSEPAGDGKNYIARLEKIVDRNGHGVQLSYTTSTGNILSQARDIHDANRRLEFVNASNHITKVRRIVPSQVAAEWNYAYDAAGNRLASVTSPTDLYQTTPLVVRYEYYAIGPALVVGLMSKIIEPDGAYHKYEYFANGRVFRVTQSIDTKQTPSEIDDVTNSQTFNYNLFREVTEFTDENGNVETYIHDKTGQLLRQVHDDRSRAIYEYGTEVNGESTLMVKATDERGAFEIFDYYRPGETGYTGRRGELETYTDKDGLVTKFEYWTLGSANYDHISELSQIVVNPGGANITTTYTRNTVGNLTKLQNAEGNSTTYSYYAASDGAHLNGLLKSQTQSLGVSWPASAEAVIWEPLTEEFTITGNTISVRLVKTKSDKVVVADAIRIDRLDTDGTFARIVDDVIGPNFRKTGTFTQSTNTGAPRYGTGATVIGNSNPVGSSATWIFRDLEPGKYRISAVWINGTDRDPTAQYQLFKGLPGEEVPAIVEKNQTQPTVGFRSYQTVFQYDTAGNVTSAFTEKLPASTAVYDHFGKVISSTDATAVTSFAVNDVLGRTVKAGLTDPDGSGPLAEFASTFAYDAMGRLISTTDALGRLTTSQYDLMGRLVKQTFADGTSARFGYDAKGNRTSITDELGRTTRFVYDARDRLIQKIYPDGAADRIRYDGVGNVVATIDALGRRTEFTYDKAGRLLTTKSATGTPDQVETVNKYDGLGRLVETIDANRIITQYKRDKLGRVTQTTVLDSQHTPVQGSQLTPPDTSRSPIHVSTVEYDANGRAVKSVIYDPTKFVSSEYAALINDPTSLITTANIDTDKVRVTETVYDAFNRPIGMKYADGNASRTIYDAAGRVPYQFDELGRRTESIYDEYGRLEQLKAPDPDGILSDQSSPVTEFQYDAVGNIIATIDPRGFTTSREYDARNRMIAATDGVGAVRRSIYDVAGQIVATIDPRGFAASTRYDDRGRSVLQRLVDPDGAGIALAPTTQYTYDAVGNLLSTTDPLGNTTWFEYDSLNRLREESRYETIIADDADGGDATFSANADPVYYVDQTARIYGRDITYWEAPASAPQATWTFKDLEQGEYRVSMTWYADPSYDNDAQVEILVQGSVVATFTVDQRSRGDIHSSHGAYVIDWGLLNPGANEGVNVANGQTLQVRLTGHVGESLVADAVRIERLVSRNYGYDNNGNLIQDTDTRGNITTYVYDELNRPTQTITADPDGAGTLKQLINAREYDGFGNMIVEHHGHITSLVPLQALARRTDTFEYDKRNRLTKETIDAGVGRFNVTTAYKYDAVGNTVLVTDAEDFQSHYRYDNLNRLIDEYRDFGQGRPQQAMTFSQASLYYPEPPGGTAVVSAGGSVLTLTDDMWVYAPIGSHQVDFRTVLEFDLKVDKPADYVMIGFDTNTQFDFPEDDFRYFEIAGRETFGDYYKPDFRTKTTGETVRVHIPIGQYLTLSEQLGFSINQLVFYTYNEGNAEPADQSKVSFSDVRLYQSDEVRTVTTYDAAGNVASVRTASDPRNIATRYAYDGVGRQTRKIIEAVDPGGAVEPFERKYSTVYDAAGNVLVERNDSAGTQTVHEYDPLNHLVKSTLPDADGNPATFNGLVSKFSYDVAGNVIRKANGVVEIVPTIMQDIEVTYTDYDAQGRAIVQTDGNGDETHFRYDSEGNLLSLTDAEQNTTSYTYDGLNRLATDTNQFGTRTNVYDNAGNLNYITDRNGRIRGFNYDKLDRRIQEIWLSPDFYPVHYLSWQYDSLNRVTKQVDSNNAVLGDADDVVDTFTYDGLGRLVEQTNYDPVAALGASGRPEVRETYGYRFVFTFDAFHNWVTREQFIRGELQDDKIGETIFEYDVMGRLSTLLDGPEAVSAFNPLRQLYFGYDAASNLNKISRSSSGAFIQTDLVHDKANRLTSITHDLATDILHTYAYDNASRITSFDTAGSSTDSRSYAYDGAGQLTSKTGGTAESYVYDDNGNRLAANGQNVVTGQGNRLLEDADFKYYYDREGNLTAKQGKSDGLWTHYEWDHRNRLISVSTSARPPAIDFARVDLLSYAGQDAQPSGFVVEDYGATLHITGNSWKAIDVSQVPGVIGDTYSVTANTILEFDFWSPTQGEIQGIGLDDNLTSATDPTRYFKLYGIQAGGISPGVSYGGGWQHYEIQLGNFAAYAGLEARYLVLINDEDPGGATNNGQSYFRNVRLSEGTPAVSSSISYAYDAAGNRVKRTHDPDGAGAQAVSSHHFVYDGSDLSMTFDNAGQLTHRYLYGPQVDQVLVDEVFTSGAGGQRVSDEVLWLLADHQGTIRDIADSNGTLRKHVDYDSFGNITGEDYYDRNAQVIPSHPTVAMGAALVRYAPGVQDIDNQILYGDDAMVVLTGNTWQAVEVNYTITPDTVLEFDFHSLVEGEVHAIGFESDLVYGVDTAGQTFKLYGTETPSGWRTEFDDYDSAQGFKHYTIPVGQLLAAGLHRYLVLVNDNDTSSPQGKSRFQNIELYERSAPLPPQPSHAEAIDQLFGYTGQEWDADTKLQNNNARWYDPRLGRFLSADPSGFDAGDPNLYRYVGNSPLNGTDPTGLSTLKPTQYLPGLSAGFSQYSTFDNFGTLNNVRNLGLPTVDQSIQQALRTPTSVQTLQALNNTRPSVSEIQAQVHNAYFGELYRREHQPQITDPVMLALGNPRVQGALQIATGVVQVGVATAVAPVPVAGVPLAALIAFRGGDNIGTGTYKLTTGQQRDTVGQIVVDQGLQRAGVDPRSSHQYAGYATTGFDVLSTLPALTPRSAPAMGTKLTIARSADDWGTVAPRNGGIVPVRTGQSGEAVSMGTTGLPVNTNRIPSASGQRAYRIPDHMEPISRRYIAETKNVNYQSLTSQILDDAAYVNRGGLPGRVDVIIDSRTTISLPLLRQHLNQGSPIKVQVQPLSLGVRP